MCALDVIAVLLYFCYTRRTLPRQVIGCLMRLGASVWLLWLHARGSRRARTLLENIGYDPWRLGWDRLWNNSVIYLSARARIERSRWGPLVYIGGQDVAT